MSEPGTVDPQIVDAIDQAQAATMDAQVVRTGGAGKAYESVAQSAAIAVQDAADALRNAATLATAAAGTALAQFLASGDPRYLEALAPARGIVEEAVADFAAIGAAAARLLNEFPSG